MSQAQMKKMAAQAALKYITDQIILGVGTGSTVKYFIEVLDTVRNKIKGTIASSEETKRLLLANNFTVLNLNDVNEVELYVDGADAYNKIKQLVKGGRGALTREKIIASASKTFICIVDETKFEDVLGKFPIPVEVIPMARSFVAREIVKLGGQPVWRQNFITDNGNVILDIHNMKIDLPIDLEERLNNIPGVVCNGLFTVRGADKIIIGHTESVTVVE